MPPAGDDGARTPGRSAVDWEAVEREFRAGQLSVREVGRIHGVSHTAINKRAAAEKWPRDLSARVRETVAAKLAAEGIASRVSEGAIRETVETAALRDVEVVRSHRKDIGSLRAMAQRLVDGMSRILGGTHLEPGDDALLGSRQGAIDGVEKLAAMMGRLVTLERQAFNLDGKGGPDEGGGASPMVRVYIPDNGRSVTG